MSAISVDITHFKLSKSWVRCGFDRIASRYDQAAVLQREVGVRMLERLELVKLAPVLILDVGCGTGASLPGLLSHYRHANVLAVDLSTAMLAGAKRRRHWLRRPLPLCGDAEMLPLADDSCELIFANMLLPWCELEPALREFRRVLAPEGLLLFSTFGPDTLMELRQDWQQVDNYTHINAFFDMHDIGDALMRVGLSGPVMDTEQFTLTYGRFADLLRDVRHCGGGNAVAGRRPGFTGKGRMAMLEHLYERRRRDGVLPVTAEVVYGHAWGVPGCVSQVQRDGGVGIPVSAIRRHPV